MQCERQGVGLDGCGRVVVHAPEVIPHPDRHPRRNRFEVSQFGNAVYVRASPLHFDFSIICEVLMQVSKTKQ